MISCSRAMRLRDLIAELDLPHRKGFRLSEWDGKGLDYRHLVDEVDELCTAIDEYAIDVPEQKCIEHVREEAADVFACLLQVVSRLGMTFEDLDNEAVRKLRLRFIGTEAIPIE